MNETAPNPDSSEPLFGIASMTAVATALIALLVAFGLPISADQQTAILGVVAVLAPLVVAVAGRSRVYSPATVARLLRR